MFWYLEPWRKYADFTGRARRREYWIFNLLNVLIFLLLAVVFIPLATAAGASALMWVPMGFFVLAAAMPTIALSVRRLHDIGRSGAWWWISLVPYVGRLIFFVMTLFDSEPGPNRYGRNPKHNTEEVDTYELAELFS